LLATAEQLQTIPGMNLTAARPLAWLNLLLFSADAAVKRWIKRDPELSARVDYYDGQNQSQLVIRQRPVWAAQTNLVAPSIGQVLPQATINVVSTAGFHHGTGGNPNAVPPTLGVTTGNTTLSFVTYTGTTATSFTGCLGGVGTLQNNPQATNAVSVYSPVVWYDPTAARGYGPTAFGTGTQMVLGQQYTVEDDSQGSGNYAPLPLGVRASHSGTLRRWAGGGYPIMGWWFPQNYYGDKLAGVREPIWNQGRGCTKVAYTSGYAVPPPDLNYAVLMTVANMVRIMPNGTDMSSEALGAYTYGVLQNSTELGSIRTTLSRWRESSWSSGR
jgi:hypothetical protein